MSRCVLVTTSDLTALSRRTFTATEIPTLTALIAAVEAFVAANCLDWSYEAAGAYHDYDGTGCDTLYLGRYVASITAVADDSSAIATTSFINKGHYLRYKDNHFRCDYENIRVTGTWGWQTAASAPEDFKLMVQQICLDALPAYFDREEASVSIGGVSQSFVLGDFTRNSMIQSTWLKYKGIVTL